MSKRLENKVAVVTGGGSSIGKGIAEKFAQEGAHVIIVGRKEEALKNTAQSSELISYVVGDITNSEIVTKIIDTVQEKFHGQLDILVNNAGWCPVQAITDMTLADYDSVFNLDVRVVVDLIIQSLP